MATACTNFLERYEGFEEIVAEAFRNKDPEYTRVLDTEHSVCQPGKDPITTTIKPHTPRSATSTSKSAPRRWNMSAPPTKTS